MRFELRGELSFGDDGDTSFEYTLVATAIGGIMFGWENRDELCFELGVFGECEATTVSIFGSDFAVGLLVLATKCMVLIC